MTTMISSDAFDIVETMIHEGGHMLGLEHIFGGDGKTVSEYSTNIMSYSSWRVHGFSTEQAQTIDDWYVNDMLNQRGVYMGSKRNKYMKSPATPQNPSPKSTLWEKFKNFFTN